jgi:hypothetical protein
MSNLQRTNCLSNNLAHTYEGEQRELDNYWAKVKVKGSVKMAD